MQVRLWSAEPREPIGEAKLSVAIRPEKVKLSRRGPASEAGHETAINRLDGVVADISYLGGTTTYKVKLDSGAMVQARRWPIPRASTSTPTA